MSEEFDDDEMLAAEYAIGLLPADEMEAARRRALSDPVFSARIAEWQAVLSEIADFESVTPPVRAKTAIMHQLFPETARVSVWRRLGLWQALAGGAVAATFVLAFILWQPGPTDQAGPLYTAEIMSQAGDFRVVAVVDKIRNEVILTRTAGAAPEGRILQVWAHGPDEPAQSVGLWPDGESIRLRLPPEIAMVQGTLTLGVSEEPIGGSVTGSPSGRVFGTVDIPNVSDSI
jgi:anti-sigma-K factor RskA